MHVCSGSRGCSRWRPPRSLGRLGEEEAATPGGGDGSAAAAAAATVAMMLDVISCSSITHAHNSSSGVRACTGFPSLMDFSDPLGGLLPSRCCVPCTRASVQTQPVPFISAVNGSVSPQTLCGINQAVKTLYLSDIYASAVAAVQLSFLISCSADHVMAVGWYQAALHQLECWFLF